MRFPDKSVKEYKVGAVDCSICPDSRTSVFNYYVFSPTLQSHTGLKAGFICETCQHKLKLTKESPNEPKKSVCH